jgi:fructokinase
MKTTPRLISFGEVLWDLLPSGPRLGGAPANLAMQAARQGLEAWLLSAVGVDERGALALKILEERQVQTGLVQKISHLSTGTVGVKLDAAGKPSYVIHENAAWDQIAWEAAVEAVLASADVVYYGTLGQRSLLSQTTLHSLLARAKARGVWRVVDINLRKPFYDSALIRASIEGANILKLSDEELDEVTLEFGLKVHPSVIETLQALRSLAGLELVVLTCGAKGAIAVSATEVVNQPGIPVKVVNTVGAGDAFTACLIAGILKKQSLSQNLLYACTVAAEICTQA